MARLVFEEDALPLDQWRAALFARLPRDDLAAAMAEVDAIAKPRDAKPYAELLARWRRARRLFFNIATRLEMDAAPGGQAVQEAIRYLAKIADWSSAKMRDAPTAAIPKAWQPHVLDAEGRVTDPRAYVFAIIDAWRAAVKRRDIFASPGTRYGDPRRGMLDGATWQASKLVVCRAGGEQPRSALRDRGRQNPHCGHAARPAGGYGKPACPAASRSGANAEGRHA